MAASTYKSTINLPQTSFPMKANLPATEPQWLERWRAQDVYGQLRQARKGRPTFVLHDGPPYANGAIHLGTALNKVVKDLIVKSKSMDGFDAPYIPGWDCHGLPIEIKVDQELGAEKAKLDAVEIRRRCEAYARKYVDLQRAGFERLGVFGQWDDPYLTLKPGYEAEIAASLLQFINEGYAYKGLRPVYWCVHDRTALAEAEVEYKDHTSPTVWLRYAWAGGTLPQGLSGERLYAAAWTTTPWTLPASMALAFHPELEYAAMRAPDGDVYLVAAARVAALRQDLGERFAGAEELGRWRGAEFEGLEFVHPWNGRRIMGVLADYITTDQGTGIVHTAPGHGADDFATGERYKIPVMCPVNASGHFFGPESDPFQGQHIFAANPHIIALLRANGALLAEAPLVHSYPHCWRCHKPVIFRATEQWFIGLDRTPKSGGASLRERALAAIAGVRWMPAWGEERIRQMVAGRPDWCISRQRVWGVPIPVLRCDGCGQYLRDAATDARILALFRERGSNAWFELPAAEWVAPGAKCAGCGGGSFTQERDIVDVWFESGCSQAAVLRGGSAPGRPLGAAPSEASGEGLPFPADVYLEGGDQYRGWFQSSLLVAVGTRGAAPYREAVTHGWVVDAEGHTMHKSLGNAIEPDVIVSEFGAEILRLWVAASDFREEISLSRDMLRQVAEGYRKIRNTFRYMLGNLHGFVPTRDALPLDQLEDFDRYMLRQVARMAQEVEHDYETYTFHRAARRLLDFCAVELSAFYFDVLKDRLYTSAPRSRARRSGQTVLWRGLEVLSRLAAPILVVTAEEVWQEMGTAGLTPAESTGRSVHLEEYVDTDTWTVELSDATGDQRWQRLVQWREEVLKALETARQEKRIGAGLEARVEIAAPEAELALLREVESDLPALFIVSQVTLTAATHAAVISVHKANGAKCERCWNFALEVGADAEHPTLCGRCSRVMGELEGAAVQR